VQRRRDPAQHAGRHGSTRDPDGCSERRIARPAPCGDLDRRYDSASARSSAAS
jgi:hypothetical protein